MKVAASMRSPVRCTISAMGRMSFSMSAGGAVGADLHFVGDDFAGEGFDVFDGARAGAGQAEVERVDAESFHQVEDFDFPGDGGIADGWGLQAVAEGFVVELGVLYFRGRVPVVDQGGVHRVCKCNSTSGGMIQSVRCG